MASTPQSILLSWQQNGCDRLGVPSHWSDFYRSVNWSDWYKCRGRQCGWWRGVMYQWMWGRDMKWGQRRITEKGPQTGEWRQKERGNDRERKNESPRQRSRKLGAWEKKKVMWYRAQEAKQKGKERPLKWKEMVWSKGLMVRGKKGERGEKKEKSGKREKARGLMGSWLINP